MFQIQYFADGLGGWLKMPGMAMVDFPTWEMAQAEFAKFHPLPFKAALFRILNLDTLKVYPVHPGYSVHPVYSVHPGYSVIPIRSTDRGGDPNSLNQYKKRGTSVFGTRGSDDNAICGFPGYLKRAVPEERRKNHALREKFEVLGATFMDVSFSSNLPESDIVNCQNGKLRLLIRELFQLVGPTGGKQL